MTVYNHHKKRPKKYPCKFQPSQPLGGNGKRGLLHKNLHGGLPALDSATALLQYQEFMLEQANMDRVGATVLIDQSAAYDLLYHQSLLDKQQLYGLDTLALQWVSYYMEYRGTCVTVKSETWNYMQLVRKGAPWGSIMAEQFFVMYRNDLPKL